MALRRGSLVAALSALLLAAGCGGEENPRRLEQADADALFATIDDVRSSISDGECRRAARSLEEARRQVAELPPQTAVSLRENLGAWVDQAADRLPRDCEQREDEPEETPTPEETPEETVTPAPTPEETATPEPTPDETATPAPTTAPEPEPEAPTPDVEIPPADDGTGGAAAP